MVNNTDKDISIEEVKRDSIKLQEAIGELKKIVDNLLSTIKTPHIKLCEKR